VPLAGAAGFLAVALIFGFVRMSQIDARRADAPGVIVGVVQGNVGFDETGHRNRELAPRQLKQLQVLSAKLEKGEIAGVDRFGNPLSEPRGADLIVWTESSYPYSLPRWLTDPSQGGTDLPMNNSHRVKRGFTAPLIFGAITRNFDNYEDYPWNSALMIDREGRFAGRFDKIFLLMFGEYVPGLETFDFVKKIAPKASSHFNRGKDMVVFPFEHDGQQYRLGPMICYEDILPDLGRKLAEHHPHLLINITNDAWFGDTSEPWEHLALSVYRSVEMRTDLVRSVNTGVSAFIDANGRVYHESYAMDPGTKDKGACTTDDACPGGYRCTGGRCLPFGADAILGETVLMGGAAGGGYTFYAKFGNVFGYACVLAMFGLWVVWPRVRRKTKKNRRPPKRPPLFDDRAS
jgi:apolipoprotein N-acyltransferase